MRIGRFFQHSLPLIPIRGFAGHTGDQKWACGVILVVLDTAEKFPDLEVQWCAVKLCNGGPIEIAVRQRIHFFGIPFGRACGAIAFPNAEQKPGRGDGIRVLGRVGDVYDGSSLRGFMRFTLECRNNVTSDLGL